jgi:hypothetical protein
VRLDRSPWACFWLGGIATAFLVIPIVILLALPIGPAKLVGWGLIFIGLGFASVGAAGLAAKMAGRWQAATTSAETGPGAVTPGAFVRASVALELAAAFPVIGWFLLIPLAIVTSLGATVFALLRWVPAPTAQSAVAPAIVTAPTTNL